MAIVKVKDIAELTSKIESLTSKDFSEGVEKFKDNELSEEFPEFVVFVLGLLEAVLSIKEAFNTTKEITDTIKPFVDKAAKISGCIFNPGLLPELAQDIILLIMALLLKLLGILLKRAQKAILNIPVNINLPNSLADLSVLELTGQRNKLIKMLGQEKVNESRAIPEKPKFGELTPKGELTLKGELERVESLVKKEKYNEDIKAPKIFAEPFVLGEQITKIKCPVQI